MGYVKMIEILKTALNTELRTVVGYPSIIFGVVASKKLK